MPDNKIMLELVFNYDLEAIVEISFKKNNNKKHQSLYLVLSSGQSHQILNYSDNEGHQFSLTYNVKIKSKNTLFEFKIIKDDNEKSATILSSECPNGLTPSDEFCVELK